MSLWIYGGSDIENIKGAVTIVTGAASGIGRACATMFAKAQARVVLSDVDLAGAKDAAARIVAEGGDAIALRCDVEEASAFEELRETVMERYGPADIVMNNAGIILSGNPEDLPISEWQRVFDINLMSVVRSNAAFLPGMLARKRGHIVNTSSFAGIMTYAYDRLPYAASKAAIFQLSEGLALYLRPKGIGITVLCPGPVRTNIMASARIWTEGVELRGPGPEFELIEPEAVGEMVVDAVRRNIFFLSTHPQVRERLIARAADFDAVLEERIANPQIFGIVKDLSG